MVLTKVTPRKQKSETTDDELRCAMCNTMFGAEEEWIKHTLECAKQRRVKKFKCKDCDYATNKACDMKRHVARKHPVSAKVVEDSDWEKQDPGDMDDIFGVDTDSDKEAEKEDDPCEKERTVVVKDLEEELEAQVNQTEPKESTTPAKTTAVVAKLLPPISSDLEVGRVIRKPTTPSSTAVSLKRKISLSPKKIGEIKKRIVALPSVKPTAAVAKKTQAMTGTTKIATIAPPTATASLCDEKCPLCGKDKNAKRVRKTRKVTTTYQEGGKSVVEVEEEEFEY